MKFVYEGEVVAKPRMTRRDKWAKRKCVTKYFEFCNDIKKKVDKEKYGVTNKVRLQFYIQMPKSWSKKKKISYKGQPNLNKPDIDNLVKAFLDALCHDDSYVYHVEATKYWSDNPRIIAENIT